ncbi:hypothetical protein HED22_10520 [Thalassospira sp. HF15]|uniref:hypothetical protein n=1 Tax=Thalassospira sp. HF15 TaxID=2722755 RepID=UPI00143123C8|nr:hypothetical protein [Thalassospira sp. HF15]NIY76079.1 hypothetical protein [Thalassospira sp. HF15]
MAFANRISDLARTLAQYPTVVTVMDKKVDVRTKEQLATLSAETTKLEALATEGDTAIASGSCKDPAGLSTRLDFNASQISSLLTAFAAQDTERLKSMSIISKQKFDAYAKNRLSAEKRYADEVSTLLKQEAKTVAALGKSETGKPDAKPDTKPDSTPPDSTPETKPKPSSDTSAQPAPEPSLNDIIADMPGYLQAAYPDDVANYDPEQLSSLCTSTGKTAIKLGAKTADGVTDFTVASVISGQDLQKQDWSAAILKDSSLGTLDDRMFVLRNAAETRKAVDEALPFKDPASAVETPKI